MPNFRKRHLPALVELFVQVLKLGHAAGLGALRNIALDGTKVKANESKHTAMSYARMGEAEQVDGVTGLTTPSPRSAMTRWTHSSLSPRLLRLTNLSEGPSIPTLPE